MRNNIQYVFLLMAFVFAWAGCSKGGDTDVVVPDLTPSAISLRSNINGLHTVSRTPFMGELSSGNRLTARVLTSETSGDYSTLYANGTMTFSGQSAAVSYNPAGFVGNDSFPDDGEAQVFLQGLHPATGWSISSNTASVTLTGKEDLMTAAEVSTSKTEVRRQNYALLSFEHQLTLLEISVQVDGGQAVAKWGEVKSISVTKSATSQIETKAGIDLTVGTISFGTSQSSLPAYGLSVNDDVVTYSDTEYAGTVLTEGAAQSVAYVLVPPLTGDAVSKEYTFEIVTTQGGVDKTSTVAVDLYAINNTPFMGPTAGYSFVVTFYFLSGYIQGVATVKGWQEGGSSTVPIG